MLILSFILYPLIRKNTSSPHSEPYVLLEMGIDSTVMSLNPIIQYEDPS